MKREATISLSLAAAYLVFACSPFAHARSNVNTQPSMSATAQVSPQQEAQRMVFAQVALSRSIDARKIQPGYHFQAVLHQNVRLKNGTELPRDTVLMGKVVTDQMQPGNSKLALRFTAARLKDGKVIPIKAMIIGVAGPAYQTGEGSTDMSYLWNAHTLQIDAVDAVSGFDLHSKVGAHNSGVFVSSKKDNMKIEAGSQFGLAIAARRSS